MRTTYKLVNKKLDDVNADLQKLGLKPVKLTSLGEDFYQLTLGENNLHVITEGSLYEISIFLKGFHSMIGILEANLEKGNALQQNLLM